MTITIEQGRRTDTAAPGVRNADAPLARLEGVTKRYGRQVAVDAMNLDIARGQFVTLLGPSGCGKTTTLRMLGGFETPDEGRILLDGRDVTHVPPNRRDVNIVFQDYALFPHLSVARNVGFGLELRGQPRDRIARRVDELLNLVALQDYADRMPGQLSGGQRQRVALVRALAPDPQLLLLDEPLSALDAKLRGQMQLELKDVQRTTGKTFVFVTHDQEEALTMSDVVVVMNRGRIEQMGAPQTLYATPRTRFVAGFLGEANLLEVEVLAEDGDGATVRFEGRQMRVRRAGETGRRTGPATLVVRPENVRLAPAGTPATMPGRIVNRAFKGAHSRVEIVTDSGAHLSALVHNAELGALADGSVGFSWPEGDGVLLAD